MAKGQNVKDRQGRMDNNSHFNSCERDVGHVSELVRAVD